MIPLKRCAGKAVELLLNKGNTRQRRRAFRVGIELLDSPDSRLRAECEELLLGHFDSGHELIEETIKRRRIKGESEGNFQPREPTLAILLRIYRKGSELNDGPEL